MSGFTNRAQPSTVQQILESHVAQYTKDMAALHASLGAGEDAEEREKNKADRQRLKVSVGGLNSISAHSPSVLPLTEIGC